MKTIQYYIDKNPLPDNFDRKWSGVNLETFAWEFNFNFGYNISQDDNNIRLFERDCPELTWTCTDTAVGLSFVYLDKKIVAIRYQQARKSDSEYYWTSQESYDECRKYLLELLEKSERPEIKFIDFNDDLTPLEDRKKQNDEANRLHWEKYIKSNLKKP